MQSTSVTQCLQSTLARVPTQWSNIEMKQKRRMNETQIEKKSQRKPNRIDQFQLKKLAEELTIGMAL